MHRKLSLGACCALLVTHAVANAADAEATSQSLNANHAMASVTVYGTAEATDYALTRTAAEIGRAHV